MNELTNDDIRELVANLGKPKLIAEFLESRQPSVADIKRVISLQDAHQLGDATTIALYRNFILRYFVAFHQVPRFLLTAPTIVLNLKAPFPLKSGFYYLLNCGAVCIFNASYNQVFDVVVDKDTRITNGVYVRNSDTGHLVYLVGFTNEGKIDVDSRNGQFVEVATDPDLKIGVLGVQLVKPKKNAQAGDVCAETSVDGPPEKRVKLEEQTEALQRLIEKYAQH